MEKSTSKLKNIIARLEKAEKKAEKLVEEKFEKIDEPTALTENQKKRIMELWNQNPQSPPSLKTLAHAIYGGEFDGRNKRTKLIVSFLAENGLTASVSYEYIKKDEIVLTDEQKEYIAKNHETMKNREMAEVLFNKPLTNLSQETRVVFAYAKTFKPEVSKEEDIEIYDYKPPKTETAMVERLNKYIDHSIDENLYHKNEKQKRWVKTLIGYVNSYRFIQQINTYAIKEDRELFESSFLTFIFGKEDLLEGEELSQYIILCSETVISKNILERIEKFQRMADEDLEGTANERRTLAMAIVESISNLRKEYNDCVKRQQSLMNDLKGKRSERLKNQTRGSENLATLFEYWKNETSRKRLAEANMVRRAKLKDEVARLESMDALKCEIYGVSPEEILYS